MSSDDDIGLDFINDLEVTLVVLKQEKDEEKDEVDDSDDEGWEDATVSDDEVDEEEEARKNAVRIKIEKQEKREAALADYLSPRNVAIRERIIAKREREDWRDERESTGNLFTKKRRKRPSRMNIKKEVDNIVMF